MAAAGAIYEASQDQQGWQPVIEGIGSLLNCRKVTLFSAPTPGSPPDLTLGIGFDPAQFTDYVRTFAPLDEWTRAAQRKAVGSGVPGLMEELVPLEELVRTQFYADYLRPWGDLHGCGVNFRGNDHFTVVNAIRGPQEGRFSEDALRVYRLLCPHIGRALAMGRRLENLERRHQAVVSALDRLSHAIVVVDRRCRLIEANRAALAVVERRDGLLLGRGDVVAAWTRDDGDELQRLVGQAVAGQGGGAMAVRRRDGEAPYHVLVGPAHGRLTRRVDGAALFIGDPAAAKPEAGPVLARLFGLTPAEARVLMLLAEGASPEEIAATADVSINTVRSQIKALRSKTGATRISELVRLAVDSPARWVSPE